MVFTVCLLSVLVSVVVGATQRCVSKMEPGQPDFRSDPEDCSVFYVCANEILYKFRCPHSVFTPASKNCVPRGSKWDTCSRTKDHVATKVYCLPGSQAIVPHPTNCAQYYNCSGPAHGMKWEDHLQECPYSQVFNTITKQCEHYSMVKCGKRTEPLSHCDYRKNQCEAAHCIPCNVRWPSCKRLPDGLNPWVGREGSPYYVVCEGQRMLYTGTCTQEYGPQVFHPVKKMCVEAVA